MSLVSQVAALATAVGAGLKALTQRVSILESGVYSVENLVFSVSGNLSVKVGGSRYPIKGGTFTILSVAAEIGNAPGGQAVIADVNKNGTSIYGTQANRPTFAAASNVATVGTHSTSSLTTGDHITVDIDQIGTGPVGADMVLVVRIQRTA